MSWRRAIHQPLAPMYLCDVCGKIMDKPRFCQELHRFCLGCGERFIKSDLMCPVEGHKMKVIQIKESPLLQAAIKHIMIKCEFTKQGCDEGYHLEEEAAHRATCSYVAAAAKNKQSTAKEVVDIESSEDEMLSTDYYEMDTEYEEEYGDVQQAGELTPNSNIENKPNAANLELKIAEDSPKTTPVLENTDSDVEIVEEKERRGLKRGKSSHKNCDQPTKKRESDSSRRFKCPKCDFTTTEKSEFDVHSPCANRPSPFQFECPSPCGQKFSSIRRLQEHRLTHGVRVHLCPNRDCRHEFDSKQLLERHCRRYHADSN